MPATVAKRTESKQRQIISGPWKLKKQFGNQDGPGKLVRGRSITLSPDGSVVILDYPVSQMKIYSTNGDYKYSIDTTGAQITDLSQVIVNSQNTIFVTDFHEHTKMYEINGKFKGLLISSYPQTYSFLHPGQTGLAIDCTGNLLVGDCKNNSINMHRQDGTFLGRIKVGIAPRYIAVTSQDTIFIACWFQPPQIVSKTGQVMHILKHPVAVDEYIWYPHGVYCHEDVICVANESSILCYNKSGKYLGPILIPPVFPWGGLAMTADSKTLLVCEDNSVKYLLPQCSSNPLSHVTLVFR